MSGPKLMELRRMRAARERQRDHDLCAGFGSEYSRLLKEFDEWARRLAGLNVPVTESVRPLAEVKANTDALLLQGAHHEAARIFGEEVAKLRGLVEQQRELYSQRLIALQNRHQQYLRDCATLSAGRDQLKSRFAEAIPASWSEPDKARFENLIKEEAAKVLTPDWRDLPGDAAAITAFEQAEAAVQSSLAALQSAQQRLQSEWNAAAARQMSDSLQAKPLAGPSLKEVLERFSAPPETAAQNETRMADVNRLLAQLTAVADDGFLQEACQKAASVRAESDPARRRLLAESLLIDGAARLKALRESARCREEAQKMIDGAAHLDDAAVSAVVGELRSMLATGQFTGLERARPRWQAAIEAAEARREREYKRRALIEALQKLGYQTREGMESAFVKEGRLVLRRADEEEYAVEMVADADLNQVQTALVRYSGSAGELTEQQRRRDCEHEQRWCEDHARLREQLAASGLESALRMQLRPGEHPVKVVIDPGRAAAERRPAAQDRGRQQELP